MPNAKVISVDAIKQFRAAFVKFAEAVNASLGNADSDVHRALSWLDMEARSYWQNEGRKAQQKLAQAQEALRMKVLYKNIDGTTPSAVDEKKAVAKWKQRVEVCQQKLVNVQRYTNLIERESVMYKGAVQRFATTIQSGVPQGLARLDRVMNAIDQYIQAQPEAGDLSSGVSVDPANPAYLEYVQSMARAEAQESGSGVRVPGSGKDNQQQGSDPEPESQNPEPERQP
jgi:hypothetical protein